MNQKINLVAYLHIAYGVFMLLMGVIAVLFIVGGGIISGDSNAILVTSTVSFFVVAVLVILAAPSILGGWGLLRRLEWARVLVIILSFFHLFSVPIGTALGVYSLYVLFQDESRAEFA